MLIMTLILSFILPLFVLRILRLRRYYSKTNLTVDSIHSKGTRLVESVLSTSLINFSYTPSTKVATSSLWSHRLFHPSDLILNKVSKEFLHSSIDMSSSNLCVFYPFGKAYKLPLIFSHRKIIIHFSPVYVDLGLQGPNTIY